MIAATAIAHPNIALIKYWGNRDDTLNLPANGSISFNLAALEARTNVTFNCDFPADRLIINQEPTGELALARVSAVLDLVRAMAGVNAHALVESTLNFPIGTGIASSAAGFAVLALAASRAAGLDLNDKELSCLARRGSGSACRSIPAGFVEWLPGISDETSYAVSFAAPDHWALADVIVVLQNQPKKTGSREGHNIASTSPFQEARVADAPRRLQACRDAIRRKDFGALAEIIELDSNMMHAVMMTSSPSLQYWEAGSISLMRAVPGWRSEGLQVAYTLDAGPNAHLICARKDAEMVREKVLEVITPVEILISGIGGPARIVRTV
ncbi:MAG TPA: diphosphomevalonate decarboxylase [Anaerolineaceae bacterium]|nr:diphosphomevalonate decarboxylase [Anaerolineaceae bacterium]